MKNAEVPNKAILYAAVPSDGLFPATAVVPKGLLPVYDKPLIYYPLSVLILAGIREIALISSSDDKSAYQRLLGNGSQFGVQIDYLANDSSISPAESFILAREFIDGSNVAFIFADVLICGDGLLRLLAQSLSTNVGATAFARPSANSEGPWQKDSGAVCYPPLKGNASGKLVPCLSGLFLYLNDIVKLVDQLQSATSIQLGIDDINRAYFAEGRFRVSRLGRGFALFDICTHASLTAAANFICTIESTHGLKIGCVEEAAYRMGFLTSSQILQVASQMNNSYGMYLRGLVGPY